MAVRIPPYLHASVSSAFIRDGEPRNMIIARAWSETGEPFREYGTLHHEKELWFLELIAANPGMLYVDERALVLKPAAVIPYFDIDDKRSDTTWDTVVRALGDALCRSLTTLNDEALDRKGKKKLYCSIFSQRTNRKKAHIYFPNMHIAYSDFKPIMAHVGALVREVVGIDPAVYNSLQMRWPLTTKDGRLDTMYNLLGAFDSIACAPVDVQKVLKARSQVLPDPPPSQTVLMLQRHRLARNAANVKASSASQALVRTHLEAHSNVWQAIEILSQDKKHPLAYQYNVTYSDGEMVGHIMRATTAEGWAALVTWCQMRMVVCGSELVLKCGGMSHDGKFQQPAFVRRKISAMRNHWIQPAFRPPQIPGRKAIPLVDMLVQLCQLTSVRGIGGSMYDYDRAQKPDVMMTPENVLNTFDGWAGWQCLYGSTSFWLTKITRARAMYDSDLKCEYSDLNDVLRFHHECLCGGMEKLSLMALGVIADLFVNPRTAVVGRVLVYQSERQGIGKSTWLQYLCRSLYGVNHCHFTSRIDDIAGHFNAAATKRAVFADESNVSAKQWEQIKMHTGGDVRTVERKGYDAEQHHGLMSLFLATNTLELPAESEDRRSVICVADKEHYATNDPRAVQFYHKLQDPDVIASLALFFSETYPVELYRTRWARVTLRGQIHSRIQQNVLGRMEQNLFNMLRERCNFDIKLTSAVRKMETQQSGMVMDNYVTRHHSKYDPLVPSWLTEIEVTYYKEYYGARFSSHAVGMAVQEFVKRVCGGQCTNEYDTRGDVFQMVHFRSYAETRAYFLSEHPGLSLEEIDDKVAFGYRPFTTAAEMYSRERLSDYIM